MKKYAVPVVCLLLAVSVSYFIYSNVTLSLQGTTRLKTG